MLSDKNALTAECEETVTKSEERLTVMVNTLNYLQRQMEECQKSLHEMAHVRARATQSLLNSSALGRLYETRFRPARPSIRTWR